MLELESLVFKVDTKQLTEASAKIKELGTAVSSLNKPISDLANASTKVDKAQAKVKKSSEETAAATEKVNKAAKEQQTILERQKAILDFMTQGMSKGQATTLAYAQATGAATQELKELTDVLQTQRRLSGTDPFDASVSGLTVLRNRLTEVREANRLYTAGIQLTREQTRELARDKERIIERLKAEATQNGQLKVSLSDVKAALIAHNIEYIKVATQVNNLVNSEKELERQHRDSANAVRALAREEEKVDSIVSTLTGSTDHHTKTSERAAESIARYARNLRLAGVAGVEAAAKLKAYEDKIRQIQNIEEKRKVDLLSRSLAPQISDVVVSLGSGMNPMTVLLQQGLQVRDLIGQSGVEVEQLQKAFRSAASDMVSSIKGTAAALGSLLIGTIVDTGVAVKDFLLAPFTLAKAAMTDAANGTDSLSGAFMRLKEVTASVARIGLFAAVAALAALALAYRQVIKEESALSQAITLTGASLGMNKEEAVAFASSLENIGVSQTKATAALTAFAKEGTVVETSLASVTQAAVNLQKFGGVALEDTAKVVADFAKNPTEALLKYAAASGQVSVATIEQVRQLEKAGKATEAAQLAQEAWAIGSNNQAETIYNSLSPLEKLWLDIKSAIGGAWEEFKEFARGDAIATPFRKAWEVVAVVAAEVWYVLKQTGKEIGGIAAQIAAVMRGDFAGARSIGDQMKSDAQASRSAQDALVARILSGGKAFDSNTKSVKLNSKELKANADNARRLQKEYKEADRKKAKQGKSDAEKLEDERVSKINAALTVYGDLLGKNEGFLSDYNEKEAHLNFLLANKLITQGQYNEVFAELLKKQPVYLKALEEELDLLEAKRKAEELNANFNKELDEYVNGLFKTNVELEEQLALVGLTTEELDKLNKQKAAQLITEKKLALVWEESIPGNERRVELLKQEIAYLERKGVLTEDIAKATKLSETTKMWTDGITDAIVTGLFEGGKEGSKKLRDLITAELRKPITVYIQAIVGDIVGGITGSKSGGVTSGLSKLSELNNMFSSKGIGASVTGKLQYAADWLSTSSSDTLAKLGDTLGKYTNQIGNFAGQVGSAMSGYSISKMLSNGYKIDGINVNAIAAIASTVFGPIAGVIGGLVNRAFGRKLKDTGIQGTFSDEGFSGSSYQFYKGGWFASDKTKTEALGADTTSALGYQFTAMKMQTSIMAAVLNANADTIDSYTKKIKFSTKGLSEEKIQAKFEEIFAGIQEDLAKIVLDGTNFAKFGETATETLNRLYTSLITVNGALELVNQTTFAASLAGADLASQLVDSFGDLSTFSSEMGSYYDAFFTEQEKSAKAIELITKEFDTLGLTLPSTTAGYRALVEAQDLTTEEGRATFAALIKLSSGFAQATQAFESFGNAVEEEIARLRGEILQDSVNAYAAMQSQFAITTAAARAGDASALESLPELSKQVESTFLSQAGSAEDVARVRAWLADSLSTTLNVLGIPGFASGGMHTGGARIVGENGPELEVTGPSRIYSANQTSSMFDNTVLVNELVALREEVVMLRSEVRADVQHNAKTAKLLDRVIPDGDAIQTRVAV